MLYCPRYLIQMLVVFMKGDEGDGDRFRSSEVSQVGGHGRLGAATPGFEARGSTMYGAGLQHEYPAREGEEKSSDLSRDFNATLAEAPQASLIHLVNLYHQTLLRHGLVQEAENITSVLAGLQNKEELIESEELKGMDLLLKEGLLKYLLWIQPHIPQVPRQVNNLLYAISALIAVTNLPLLLYVALTNKFSNLYFGSFFRV